MAKPKVFISSTCYDLQQIRDSICTFIRNFGFEPILSENGDVFYHPDLHTHEACVNEVSNCQIFLLIIGGRFGGKYIYDKSKSITNAEYDAAVKSNIPVFTYIKRNVLDNHHLYQENKGKPFISELDFPAIDKQCDALNIFGFINQVRKASINNAYEAFDIASDIENHLRKQLAAMFFDFLKNREITKQIDHTSKSVDSLVVTTDKLEDLVKSLYVSVDKQHATSQINLIQSKSMAKSFLVELVSESSSGVVNAKTQSELEALSKIDPTSMSWYEYLAAITLFERAESTTDEIYYRIPLDVLDYENDGFHGITIEPENPYQQEIEYMYKNGICALNEEQRLELLTNFSIFKSLF
ncbi:hypothetical protein BTO10_00930 [Vibrio chagasii]|uniref:DUF4062 domain-containing protein n=1 Tax=Vibrio chagasii TaxID=170679 RepID=A0A2S7VML8_9VIBR|nr:DUF4062 domain-containing protein [Vibrio chagasii]PQJ63413.1 hypothetical protein BTO10_00930 [Vibrio chagasii]